MGARLSSGSDEEMSTFSSLKALLPEFAEVVQGSLSRKISERREGHETRAQSVAGDEIGSPDTSAEADCHAYEKRNILPLHS